MLDLEKELRQEPFVVDGFVDRLTWWATQGQANKDEFDPNSLEETFEDSLRQLKSLSDKNKKAIEECENACQRVEAEEKKRLLKLEEEHMMAANQFHSLDAKIHRISAKAVALGEQLENVNVPRARLVEARTLIKYFHEFMSDDHLTSEVFTDPYQLLAAADIIQKLYNLSIELPNNEKFQRAKQKISKKYEEIEDELIRTFLTAQHENDRETMKTYVATLSTFKLGYTRCIDGFIEEIQQGAYFRDVFSDIVPLCERASQLIDDVFAISESVMTKLVVTIFKTKLQVHIQQQLDTKTENLDLYLTTLYELFKKTRQVSTQLSVFKIANDPEFLPHLQQNVFEKHLERYFTNECKNLTEKCHSHLDGHYSFIGHQKKTLPSAQGLSDALRREFQARLGGSGTDGHLGADLVSPDTATLLLDESKSALKRIQLLCKPKDQPRAAAEIMKIVVQSLIEEHLAYALQITIWAIPSGDTKIEPQSNFLELVNLCNVVVQLFDQHVIYDILPLVSGSEHHAECIQRKKDVLERLESLIAQGIDKTLSAIVAWVKALLTAEQKRSDFKPEAIHDAGNVLQSPTCGKVVAFMNHQIKKVKVVLDGKNLEVVSTELGARFHRVLYDHMLRFEYNEIGGMLAICDLNEYRKCARELKSPLAEQLFEILHSLCNLLVVAAENVPQVIKDEHLSGLDKTVIVAFIQLRADYKTARLQHVVR